LGLQEDDRHIVENLKSMFVEPWSWLSGVKKLDGESIFDSAPFGTGTPADNFATGTMGHIRKELERSIGGDEFDYTQLDAAYNTVVGCKLALLDGRASTAFLTTTVRILSIHKRSRTTVTQLNDAAGQCALLGFMKTPGWRPPMDGHLARPRELGNRDMRMWQDQAMGSNARNRVFTSIFHTEST